MNHLLASLGIQQEYNASLDVNMLADADGAIWHQVRYSNSVIPHAAPKGTTPVALASGELIGWATSIVSKDVQAYYVMPELRAAAYKPGDLISPEATTITQLAVRRDRAGNPTLIAPSRAAVTDARDIVLFHDPPALKTNMNNIWLEMATQKFYHIDPNGKRHDIPLYIVENFAKGNALYGQHRNAPAPLHGGAAQGTSGSARAYYDAARASAAAYQTGAGSSLGSAYTNKALAEMVRYIKAVEDEAKPKKLPRADPVVGEVVAWRAWALAHAKGCENLLTSIYLTVVVWKPRETLVSQPPTDYGDIGIHAHKTHETLLKYVGEAYSTKLLVIGRVRLWGEVVEGETGYRAEFAQVESLEEILRPKYGNLSDINWLDDDGFKHYPNRVTPGDDQTLLDKLREVYGVN